MRVAFYAPVVMTRSAGSPSRQASVPAIPPALPFGGRRRATGDSWKARIPLLHQQDLADNRAYTPTSRVNRLYRRHYPSDRGVIVLGGGRAQPGSPVYQMAYELGRALAQNGLFVVNGGGNGVMEASAKGAVEAGGHAVGAGIPELRETVNMAVYPEYVIHEAPIASRIYGAGGYESRGRYKVYFPGSIGTDTELHLAMVDLYVKKARNRKQPRPDPSIEAEKLVLMDIDGFFTRGYAHGDGSWHEGFIADLKKRVAAGRDYPDMLNLLVPVTSVNDAMRELLTMRQAT